MTLLSGNIADAGSNPINGFLRIQLLQPLISGVQSPKKVSLPLQFDAEIINGRFSLELPESETRKQVYSFSIFQKATTNSFYYDNGDFYGYDGELPYILHENEYYVGYVWTNESIHLNKKTNTEEVEVEPVFYAAIPNKNSVDFADLEKTGFWNDRTPQTAKQVADILKKDPAFLATMLEIVIPTSNYSGTQLYRVGNTVLYNGFRYVCRDDGIVGILPSDRSKWIPVDLIFNGGGGLVPATTSTLGGVIVGDGLDVDATGLTAVDINYIQDNINLDIPIATTSALGGIIVGDGLDVDATGLTAVDINYIQDNINLDIPIATTSTLGGVIVGNDFTINVLGVLNSAPFSIVNVTLVANTSINLGKNNIFIVNLNLSNAFLTCTNFVQGASYIFMFFSDSFDRNLTLDPSVFKFANKLVPEFTIDGVDIISSFACDNILYCVMNNDF
ncbi:MAG: hypothetical protein AN483_12710 [Aphanizomenon flos-aquae MDT14a]|jgi:hypothetical protein|nr:MAG: hypothetical protein AN483_12710 [Aphanizomenon flos-aquae MDT14a]